MLNITEKVQYTDIISMEYQEGLTHALINMLFRMILSDLE